MEFKEPCKSKEWLERYLHGLEAQCLFLEGYDEAFLGIVPNDSNPNYVRAVYSFTKVIDCLIRENNWTYEEALDWYYFHLDVGYVDEDNHPLFVYDNGLEEYIN
jgi:hypothetical protein